MRSGRLLWFVNGNIGKDNAIEVVEKGRGVFNLQPTEKEDLSEVRTIALNPGVSYLFEIPLEDKTNENDCLISYFEHEVVGMNLKSKLIHEVVM